ncbi:FHA domain-containing protein [Emticicia sp. 17c]|uniref:FHA domain-containing protein n=1 Tax=Emticicia sp. 17c TaxID=3127704 RepID=UPI00301CB0EC
MSLFSVIKEKIIPSSLEKNQKSKISEVTNEMILKDLITNLEASIKKESLGESLLFNANFIVILHPDVYQSRQPTFIALVHEAVKGFYKKINEYKAKYPNVIPIASNWVFQFAPGVEFNDEIIGQGDVMILGTITGLKDAIPSQTNTVKVTMKPKKSTNYYEKMDINLNHFLHIDFRNDGKFAMKIDIDSPPVNKANGNKVITYNHDTVYAEIHVHISHNDMEDNYSMKEKEIVIARKEPENAQFDNYFLIDSPYVSNPHARIKYNETRQVFQITNFSRHETRLNEELLPQSDLSNPVWHDLPLVKTKLLLNGDVTLTFNSRK